MSGNRKQLRRLSETESVAGTNFKFAPDLGNSFAGKGLFVFLGRDDLFGELTQLLDVLTGIDVSKCCFKMKLLLNREAMVGHGAGRVKASPR